MIKKNFQVKVFDSSGVFIKSLSPDILTTDPNFNSEKNSGFGENSFTLQLPFDDFDEGVSIAYENQVKIYQFDADNILGRLIYVGIVISYDPVSEAGSQYVVLKTLGLGTILTRDYFKTGANYWVDYGVIVGAPADPKDMMEDVIDQVLTIYPNCGIHYDVGSIEATGSVVEKRFEDRTWLQAIEDIFILYGDGYFWRLEKDGLITVTTKPSSPTHTFEFQKHVDDAYLQKNSDSLINSVRIQYDGGVYDYSDATSIAAYGKRHKLIAASDIHSAGAAQKYAEQYVGNFKNPKLAAEIVINSSYDIESVIVGDTCKILGLKSGNNPFGNNMSIERIEYRVDSIKINLEEIRNNFGTEMKKFIS